MLVLVPHRDARLPLKAWSNTLFKAGVQGAWSFPWVAPMAVLRRSLTINELKILAHALRYYLNTTDNKCIPGLPALSLLTGNVSVYGPSLSINTGDDFLKPVADAVNRIVSPLVIGSALISDPLPDKLPAAAPLPFHAAALANMIYDIKDDNYIEWTMGPLQWLPKKIRDQEK